MELGTRHDIGSRDCLSGLSGQKMINIRTVSGKKTMCIYVSQGDFCLGDTRGWQVELGGGE